MLCAAKARKFPACLANYVPVTRPEFKAFIAVNIIMGMVKPPSIAVYWSSNYFFGKVHGVFDRIHQKCQINYKPSKNISVDEGMIAYRGRLSFLQYMPTKPTNYGIKMWMAADSSNGYVLNFDVYLGKEEGQQRIHGLGYE